MLKIAQVISLLLLACSCGERPKSRMTHPESADAQNGDSWIYGPLLNIDKDLLKELKSAKTYHNGSSTPETRDEYSLEGDWKVKKTTIFHYDGTPATWISKQRITDNNSSKITEEINTTPDGDTSQTEDYTEYNHQNQIVLNRFTGENNSTELKNNYDQDQRLASVDWVSKYGTTVNSKTTSFDYSRGEILTATSLSVDGVLTQSYHKDTCVKLIFTLNQPFCDPEFEIKHYWKYGGDKVFELVSDQACVKEQNFYNCRVKTKNSESLAVKFFVAFKSNSSKVIMINPQSTSMTETIHGPNAYQISETGAYNSQWMPTKSVRQSTDPTYAYECTDAKTYDETDLNILSSSSSCKRNSNVETVKTIYEY
jgi:hypothetical protein